jgi:hypothetical protein
MKSFNSIEYSWKDLEVVVLGRPLIRILEVEYTIDSEQKAIYGRGKKALGIQSMNEKVTGQITVGQSELESMIKKAKEIRPGTKLTDIAFDINVGYLADTEVIRDRIVSVQISSFTKSMKQGDSDMQIKLPFAALDIEFNI